MISITDHYVCLRHQSLVGKHYVCQEVGGLYWFGKACHRHNCVSEACPLVSASCSWHLQFTWSLTNWIPWTLDECHVEGLYLLNGDTSASTVPFQDTPSFQKLVPCFDPLCTWCCFVMNTMKVPLYPHIGLRTPHNNLHFYWAELPMLNIVLKHHKCGFHAP